MKSKSARLARFEPEIEANILGAHGIDEPDVDVDEIGLAHIMREVPNDASLVFGSAFRPIKRQTSETSYE